MEDFVEHFQYNLQSSSHSDLDKDILKIFFLWALREESLEPLNVVEKGDISKDDFDTICELCINCSHGVARQRQGSKPSIHPVVELRKQKLETCWTT